MNQNQKKTETRPSEFQLIFNGHLSRFLQGQGLDVHRITGYWIEFVPQEQQGRICVTFLRNDGDEDMALLPADLERFLGAI